jgi:DNA-binding beta-propeller fold protein YncE
MKTVVTVVATCLALSALSTALAADAPDYKVVRSVSLGAPDGWDYVVYDPPSHRVYVAHGDHLSVVDGRNGSIVGTIEDLPGGTHGIAIAAYAHRGYTDEGRSEKVDAFDLKTLKVTGSLPAQADTDALAYDPKSRHVFAVNGNPGTLTVIDPRSDTVVTTISTGGKLENLAADGKGHLFVNGVANNVLLRIDTKTNAVLDQWPMGDCKSPTAMALDLKSQRVISTCRNGWMMILDANNGRIVASIPIGRGTDGAAFDPKRRLAFSSNGIDGTLTVVQEKNPNTWVPMATIKTVESARTMGIDPATGRLYLAAADFDQAALAAQRAAPPPPPGGPPRITPIVPGSLKLLFLDPVDSRK